MSGSYFDDVLRDPRDYGIKNITDKGRRPGAVRRRRDAVCTERIVARQEVGLVAAARPRQLLRNPLLTSKARRFVGANQLRPEYAPLVQRSPATGVLLALDGHAILMLERWLPPATGRH